jgi:hypothetical protein
MTENETRQIAADYGCDVTRAEGARAYLRATVPSAPSKIETARDYVRIVRRVAPWTRRVDGRLIAAVWREPSIRPRAWIDPADLGRQWIDYWHEAAPRPDVVGSCYNPTPETVARAWRLGIPAERVRALGSALSGLPASWRGSRDRIRALLRVARVGFSIFPEEIKTADLRRLARLSRAALRYLVSVSAIFVDDSGRIDWQRIARALRKYTRLPREELMLARVPATDWQHWTNLGVVQGWIERTPDAAERLLAAISKRLGVVLRGPNDLYDQIERRANVRQARQAKVSVSPPKTPAAKLRELRIAAWRRGVAAIRDAVDTVELVAGTLATCGWWLTREAQLVTQAEYSDWTDFCDPWPSAHRTGSWTLTAPGEIEKSISIVQQYVMPVYGIVRALGDTTIEIVQIDLPATVRHYAPALVERYRVPVRIDYRFPVIANGQLVECPLPARTIRSTATTAIDLYSSTPETSQSQIEMHATRSAPSGALRVIRMQSQRGEHGEHGEHGEP